MDWKFITHHLVSGNIVVMAVLALFFTVLLVIGKKQAIGSKSWISQVQTDDPRFYYEPALLWVMSLLIMPTVQPYMCNVLFPVNMAISEMHMWK